MTSNRLRRSSGYAVAVVAITAAIAGCAASGNQAPTPTPTTTTPTTVVPSVTPTDKGLDPTAGNKFSPEVLAPPAPTEPPGVHRNKN
jgi:hypothetical protein